MFPLDPSMYIELAALLCSLLFFKNIRSTALQWLPLFLGFICCIEFAAKYMRSVLHKPNTMLFNISIPIEYLVYGLLLYAFMHSKLLERITIAAVVIVVSFALINILFIQPYYYLLATNTLKLGSFVMIILSGLALVDVFMLELNIALERQPIFWLSIGLLFFNVGEFVYFSFLNTMLKNGWDNTASLFKTINGKLIFVLYGCIILSILCTKPIQKKT
jgi:hypothetical protein